MRFVCNYAESSNRNVDLVTVLRCSGGLRLPFSFPPSYLQFVVVYLTHVPVHSGLGSHNTREPVPLGSRFVSVGTGIPVTIRGTEKELLQRVGDKKEGERGWEKG